MKSEVAALFPEASELEDFRRSVNRKLWTAIAGLLVVAIGALGLTLIAVARPIPVVAFDQEGRAILFKDTVSPRRRLENVRVEYFAKEFLQHFVAVDSLNASDDFAAALNVMSPRFRKIVMADGKESERRGKLKDQNMKSRLAELKTKIGTYDPDAVDGQIYLVAWGRLTYEARLGDEAGLPKVEHWFYTQLVLERVPVTSTSIHGLVVDFVQTKFLDSAEALEAHLLKQQQKPE